MRLSQPLSGVFVKAPEGELAGTSGQTIECGTGTLSMLNKSVSDDVVRLRRRCRITKMRGGW